MLNCVVPENINKGKYEPKLEFPEGLGGNDKPLALSVGGVWIFFQNNTILSVNDFA